MQGVLEKDAGTSSTHSHHPLLHHPLPVIASKQCLVSIRRTWIEDEPTDARRGVVADADREKGWRIPLLPAPDALRFSAMYGFGSTGFDTTVYAGRSRR